jgi:hypothetical protein
LSVRVVAQRDTAVAVAFEVGMATTLQ